MRQEKLLEIYFWFITVRRYLLISYTNITP